ncbi:MAG: paraquat-inducible protein A [Thermodesulfobacteriota bacterium]
MSSYIACHECDLIHKLEPLPPGAAARCVRCGAVLYRKKINPLDRTLAFALAGLVLFALSNTFPFLAFKIEATIQETILITGIRTLFDQDMKAVAGLVLLNIIIVPLFQMLGLLYVTLPLKYARIPMGLPRVFRFIRWLQPWSMMEVFMLGILVAMVKLKKMATIIPGVAAFSFLGLIFIIVAMSAALDDHYIWEQWEKLRCKPATKRP